LDYISHFFFFFFNKVPSSSSLLRNNPKGVTQLEKYNTSTKSTNTISTPKGEKTKPKGHQSELEIKNLYPQNQENLA
jgi:hypothetical protein